MGRQIRRYTSWTTVTLVALLVLAACTATVVEEPAAGNVGGPVAAIAESEAVEIPEIGTSGGEASVQVEAEVTSGETAPEAAAETVEESVSESEAPRLDIDTTIETDVEIFTEDNRPLFLQRATAGWNTNWNRRTVEYSEILSGGPPRDGIPSIDNPKFISADDASEWLPGNEPVIALELNGDARAYPLQILTWHEIANDTVGGIPVVVTFCPLCNSAVVFDRRVNGEVFEFGVSGLLRHSDLIMYDRTTETLWQQFTGDAIVGELVGRRLKFLPSSLVGFDDFRAAHPEGIVLSRDTGFPSRLSRYGLNPYGGYDTIGQNPFLFQGRTDDRLPAMERVVTVALDDVDVAYPLSILSELGVINDSQGGRALVVFHTDGTSSALGAQVIAEAEDVGATGVFDPNLDGQKLSFVKEGNTIVDEQTGTVWNILGQGVEGPLAGQQLAPIIHGDHFWFSWAAFQPDTIIFAADSTS